MTFVHDRKTGELIDYKEEVEDGYATDVDKHLAEEIASYMIDPNYRGSIRLIKKEPPL
jgi:hypothetical protein